MFPQELRNQRMLRISRIREHRDRTNAPLKYNKASDIFDMSDDDLDNQTHHEIPIVDESMHHHEEEGTGTSRFSQAVSPIALLGENQEAEFRGRSFAARNIFGSSASYLYGKQRGHADIALLKDRNDLKQSRIAYTFLQTERSRDLLHTQGQVDFDARKILNGLGTSSSCVSHIDDDGISLDFSSLSGDYDVDSDMFERSQSSLTSMSDTPSSVDALLSCTDEMAGIDESDAFYSAPYHTDTEESDHYTPWNKTSMENHDVGSESRTRSIRENFIEKLAYVYKHRSCGVVLSASFGIGIVLSYWVSKLLALPTDAGSVVLSIIRSIKFNVSGSKVLVTVPVRRLIDLQDLITCASGMFTAYFGDVLTGLDQLIINIVEAISVRLFEFVQPYQFYTGETTRQHVGCHGLTPSNVTTTSTLSSKWMYAEIERIKSHRKILENIVETVLEESRLAVAHNSQLKWSYALRKQYLRALAKELADYESSVTEQGRLVQKEIRSSNWSYSVCTAKNWQDLLASFTEQGNRDICRIISTSKASMNDAAMSLKSWSDGMLSDSGHLLSSWTHSHTNQNLASVKALQSKVASSVPTTHFIVLLLIASFFVALLRSIRRRCLVIRKRQELHPKRWQKLANQTDILNLDEDDAIEFIPATKLS